MMKAIISIAQSFEPHAVEPHPGSQCAQPIEVIQPAGMWCIFRSAAASRLLSLPFIYPLAFAFPNCLALGPQREP
jgi:hypothetical protein